MALSQLYSDEAYEGHVPSDVPPRTAFCEAGLGIFCRVTRIPFCVILPGELCALQQIGDRQRLVGQISLDIEEAGNLSPGYHCQVVGIGRMKQAVEIGKARTPLS